MWALFTTKTWCNNVKTNNFKPWESIEFPSLIRSTGKWFSIAIDIDSFLNRWWSPSLDKDLWKNCNTSKNACSFILAFLHIGTLLLHNYCFIHASNEHHIALLWVAQEKTFIAWKFGFENNDFQLPSVKHAKSETKVSNQMLFSLQNA